MANERTDTKGKPGSTVTITLVKSTTGFKDNQEVVARGLGLRKLHSSVVHKDTPAIRGMIHKIRHLVEVK
jgi:large subunit ribosomal protein L30